MNPVVKAACAASLLLPLSIPASEVESIEEEIRTLKERLHRIELEQAKSGERTETVIEELATLQNEGWFQGVDPSKSHSGLGSAASKVYYTQNPLSIGGYGEIYWADSSDGTAITDLYRFVPYIGYKFSDRLILNTELEFEHGGDVVAIEFLYLDFLLDPAFNLRVGNQLVPMGLVNLRHEPTLFPSVQRPETEKYIIPSTWQETGIVAYGELSDRPLYYHVGFVNALNVNSDATRNGEISWLREGRWGSDNKATMQRLALTARLDYSGIEGLTAGLSGYYANGSNAPDANVEGTRLFIYDLHAVYRNGNAEFKGLFTEAILDGAEHIGPDAAERARGGYVTAQYDIRALVNAGFSVPLFIRYENYNPVAKSVGGANETADIENITFGLNLFPHEQVVLKADYRIKDRNDGSEREKTLSLGLGFIF
ncbi:hypothetical protein [Hydrogenimonas sp.]